MVLDYCCGERERDDCDGRVTCPEHCECEGSEQGQHGKSGGEFHDESWGVELVIG